MLRVIAAAAGVAAGFVLLSPVVASAADPTSMKITVSGSTVTITGTCFTSGVKAEVGIGVSSGQEHIDYHVMAVDGKRQSFTFTGVRPGNYRANMSCSEDREGFGGLMRAFTVGKAAKPAPSTQPAKPAQPQVAVKPQGAPQTGGGPAEDESTATLLVAGGAVALVGVAGAVALRRRAARR
ncbi:MULTISPECIES: hypothetical protein [Amycolatopsis]|uniref:Gram-positive cocci surface proteins LPxTG domain-containing protein n=1 Tax=Amycolatopsis bullii TaxID=941987 RepID=A0ABQ3KJ32_9PSEU|nr:hypothetical protein [Amycolatopsis bullii]GHG29150.1 hypothetical protein GCM10017567_56050 [Amycolatopsis bullii]